MDGNGKEKTLRMIANGLARRPAYLLLFGLGVIGGGVSGAVALMGDGQFQVFSVGSLFIFMLVSALAVVRVEETHRETTTTLIPDSEAKREFMDGPNAARMSGSWALTWKWDSGDDVDVVAIVVSGAIVFGTSFDDEQARTYWMMGRIDEEGDMPALFWGCSGGGPVGCAFLSRRSNSLFVGTWKGIDKRGNAGHCDATLERKG